MKNVATMKNVLFLLPALLLSACASTKKSFEASMIKVDSLGYQATSISKVERFADTTKTTTGRLVVTEIEFSQSDTGNALVDLSIKDGRLNIGSIKGKPIKSIKQTAIEHEDERKGESKEKHDSKEQKQSASLQKENVKQTKQVAPAPNPYKWRYVFYLSLVLLTGVLYFKRMPIINWTKKMLCGLIKR